MTWRDYECRKCRKKRRAGKLFDALKNYRDSGPPICENCGKAMELILHFDFHEGVGRTRCTVLDVFLPDKAVTLEGTTFYPFLVAFRRGKNRAYWLPYWHVGSRRKYGQWATFVDESILANLLSQARTRGYLLK